MADSAPALPIKATIKKARPRSQGRRSRLYLEQRFTRFVNVKIKAAGEPLVVLLLPTELNWRQGLEQRNNYENTVKDNVHGDLVRPANAGVLCTGTLGQMY
ncbi:hypothetical protein AgCh_033283 [Apium graveolens]